MSSETGEAARGATPKAHKAEGRFARGRSTPGSGSLRPLRRPSLGKGHRFAQPAGEQEAPRDDQAPLLAAAAPKSVLSYLVPVRFLKPRTPKSDELPQAWNLGPQQPSPEASAA